MYKINPQAKVAGIYREYILSFAAFAEKRRFVRREASQAVSLTKKPNING
ncbi:MAG: hypothetical protein GX061_07560 [Eubacteriaceae bacterium]|nr:hypothetical protein [Eubacteriaceae bacterium]